uniref:Uncharacterized protein n=1 Tax=Oryza glumipatula TaxID=40148 RepID=A0A0D9ZHI9_9ORYZ
MLSFSQPPEKQHECVRWLDMQPPASMLFLCFGSKGLLPPPKVHKIAAALERSGHRFQWVLCGLPKDSRQGQRVPTDSILDELCIQAERKRGQREKRHGELTCGVKQDMPGASLLPFRSPTRARSEAPSHEPLMKLSADGKDGLGTEGVGGDVTEWWQSRAAATALAPIWPSTDAMAAGVSVAAHERERRD